MSATCEYRTYSAERFPQIRPCGVKAFKDGRCKRHHPDTIAASDAKIAQKDKLAMALWNAEVVRDTKANALLARVASGSDILHPDEAEAFRQACRAADAAKQALDAFKAGGK